MIWLSSFLIDICQLLIISKRLPFGTIFGKPIVPHIPTHQYTTPIRAPHCHCQMIKYYSTAIVSQVVTTALWLYWDYVPSLSPSFQGGSLARSVLYLHWSSHARPLISFIVYWQYTYRVDHPKGVQRGFHSDLDWTIRRLLVPFARPF